MSTLTATVEAVCLSTPGVRVAKAPVAEAFLGPYGFAGDRHEAELRRLRNGRVVPNLRQWSAVATQEVAGLCREIGVRAFDPGALGENLLLSGIRLANIRRGTVLEFASGARLEVSGQNDPCLTAARELSATYGAVIRDFFIERAFGRRGVVGRVLEIGLVREGDAVRVLLPQLALPLD